MGAASDGGLARGPRSAPCGGQKEEHCGRIEEYPMTRTKNTEAHPGRLRRAMSGDSRPRLGRLRPASWPRSTDRPSCFGTSASRPCTESQSIFCDEQTLLEAAQYSAQARVDRTEYECAERHRTRCSPGRSPQWKGWRKRYGSPMSV